MSKRNIWLAIIGGAVVVSIAIGVCGGGNDNDTPANEVETVETTEQEREPSTTVEQTSTAVTVPVEPIAFSGEGNTVETFHINAGTYIVEYDVVVAGYAVGTLKSLDGGCKVQTGSGEKDFYGLLEDGSGQVTVDISEGGNCVLQIERSSKWSVEITKIA